MSTTSLTAGEVMDRSAALLNDPAKTDYTYAAQLPYLNMAVDELIEELEESNSSPTDVMTSIPIQIPIGTFQIAWTEYPSLPHYPSDLVEIQKVSERLSGSQEPFIDMVRRDFLSEFPVSSALMFWSWEGQIIKFNPKGASSPREIQIQYVCGLTLPIQDQATLIPIINARSYLSYKTAALCAMFIGENETRAEVLDKQADKALERLGSINNKGRQQIMTRHRPFRAGWKARGGF